MTNVTPFTPRTPLERYQIAAKCLTEDEGAQAIVLLNRVRTGMVLSPDEERLVLKLMGRGSLRQTEGVEG